MTRVRAVSCEDVRFPAGLGTRLRGMLDDAPASFRSTVAQSQGCARLRMGVMLEPANGGQQ